MHVGTLFAGAWIMYFRKKTVREAYELVAGDKKRYDGVWAQLLEREPLGIGRICEVVRRSGVSASQVAQPRQMRDGGGRVPEKSLDALYKAARECNWELRDRVRKWGKASGGSLFRRNDGFDDRDKDRFVRARSVEEDNRRIPSLAKASWDGLDDDFVLPACGRLSREAWCGGAEVEWCKMKSPLRAIEKIYRIYEGDSSWLVDLCRQSIIFDDTLALSRCLEAILSDPDVHVERIKCRYDSSYDSSLTCGYRDVAINMRIGGRLHVCELLLILKNFALLKRSEGHSRYRTFRNLRGI